MLLIRRLDRSLIGIIGCVILAHLVMLWMMNSLHSPLKTVQPRRPVHVQSIQLQPRTVSSSVTVTAPHTQQESTPSTSTPKPTAKRLEKSKPNPKPKKEEAKKEKVNPTSPSSPPVAKTKISGEKLADARASLRNISHALPAKEGLVADSVPDSAAPITEASYEEALIERLQLLLTLPDYGSVKVNLTLDRAGHVLSLVISKAENEKNRQYVEQNLAGLKLPPFGRNFAGEQSHTFQVVLSN